MAGLNKLTAVKIKAAKDRDTLQDGGGLMLKRTKSGGASNFQVSNGYAAA